MFGRFNTAMMEEEIVILTSIAITYLLIRVTIKVEQKSSQHSCKKKSELWVSAQNKIHEEAIMERRKELTINYMEFAKTEEEGFELIWKAQNVSGDYHAKECLDDDQYIYYKIYEDAHWKELYKKYLPNVMIFRGDNPNIIFHGGCLGCKSQRLHGIDRCKGCTYFRHSAGSEDLHIEGEDADTIDDWDEFIGGIKS